MAGKLCSLAEEDEARLADGDLVAVFERVLAHRLSVDESPVHAVEVEEAERVARAADGAVSAREQRVGDAD